MYREKIINIQTGEETWRDYTPEEVAEIEKEKEKIMFRFNLEKERIALRQSALSKLAALGLTEEEIAAL